MRTVKRRRKVNRRRGRNKHGPRNFLVPVMLAHTKPGAHRDKRKEAARKACRGILRPDVDEASGLFFDPRAGEEEEQDLTAQDAESAEQDYSLTSCLVVNNSEELSADYADYADRKELREKSVSICVICG